MDVMSLCNSRATWAAVGGGDGYGIPASLATVHRRIVDAIALEDQVARPIPAKRGVLAGEQVLGLRASGWLTQACLRQ